MKFESTIQPSTFEEAYHALREKENRVYSDAELALLPDVPKDHHYYSEWKLRRLSAERLIRYISKKEGIVSILEVGCGNGWLSNLLASGTTCRVTGTDLHKGEIRQAKQVFAGKRNLEFIEGDFLSFSFPRGFDLIIFAAAFQYFPSIPQVIRRCKNLLSDPGEIHILDTHFYTLEERTQAFLRSMDHFRKQDLTVMSEYYNHHSWADLEPFEYEVLYTPNQLLSRLGMLQNPFPWIRIKK